MRAVRAAAVVLAILAVPFPGASSPGPVDSLAPPPAVAAPDPVDHRIVQPRDVEAPAPAALGRPSSVGWSGGAGYWIQIRAGTQTFRTAALVGVPALVDVPGSRPAGGLAGNLPDLAITALAVPDVGVVPLAARVSIAKVGFASTGPLEVLLIKETVLHGVQARVAVGYRAAEAPDSFVLSLRRAAAATGYELSAEIGGAPAELTILGEAGGRDAASLALSLSPPPARLSASVDHARVAWEASESTLASLGARWGEASAARTLAVRADLPPSLALSLAPRGEGSLLSLRADRALASVEFAHTFPGGFLSGAASGVPARLEAAIATRGRASFLLDAASPLVALAVESGGERYFAFDLRGVPARLAFAYGEDGVSYRGDGPIASATFAFGNVPEYAHVAGDYVAYLASAGQWSLAGRLSGLSALVYEQGEGGWSLAMDASGGAPLRVLLSSAGAIPTEADLRLDALPARLRLAAWGSDAESAFSYEASSRPGLAGTIWRGSVKPAFADALPASGIAYVVSRFGDAFGSGWAVNVDAIPRSVRSVVREVFEEAPAASVAKARNVASRTEFRAAALPDDVSIEVVRATTRNGLESRTSYAGSSDTSDLTVEYRSEDRARDRRMHAAARIAVFPRDASVVYGEDSLALSFPGPLDAVVDLAAGPLAVENPLMPPRPKQGVGAVVRGPVWAAHADVRGFPQEVRFAKEQGTSSFRLAGLPEGAFHLALDADGLRVRGQATLPGGSVLEASAGGGAVRLRHAGDGPASVAVEMDRAGGPSLRFAAEDLPSEFSLEAGSGVVRYAGSAPGARLSLQGALSVLDDEALGPDARIAFEARLPSAFSLETLGGLRMAADEPMSSSLRLSEARVPVGLGLRFPSKSIVAELRDVRDVGLRAGFPAVTVAGSTGSARVAHEPAGPAGNVLLVEGAPGHAPAARWNGAELALDGSERSLVYALNPWVLFEIHPVLGVLVYGGIAGMAWWAWRKRPVRRALAWARGPRAGNAEPSASASSGREAT